MNRNHAYRLWSLLVFELWQQMFLDPAVPPATEAKVESRKPKAETSTPL